MAGSDSVCIVHPKPLFSYGDACRVFDAAVQGGGRTVVVDLTSADYATTSAFAHLVLLRRALLQHGRDLRLKGLRDRTARVYQISRLHRVLPTW